MMAAPPETASDKNLSSFGSFGVREKGERIGRNPKTGAKIHVPPKRSPFFKVGKELREMVDKKPAPPAAPAATDAGPSEGNLS